MVKTLKGTLPLIYNPTAGGGSARKAYRAQKTLRDMGVEVQMLPTTGPGSAEQLAARAAQRGIPRVLIAGGDGTLNETINGLAGTATEIAIIPTGTANVLAVELQIPFNVRDAARLAVQGDVRYVDLGLANGRYFALMAGIGFDALVIKNLNPILKRSIRRAAYPVSGLVTFIQRDLPLLTVTAGGEETEGYFVIAANSRYYGGKFGPTPDASMYDGLLDVCVLRGKSLQEMLNFWVAALRFNKLDEKFASYIRTDSLQVKCVSGLSVPFQTDGEVVGELPVDISVAAASLKVVSGSRH